MELNPHEKARTTDPETSFEAAASVTKVRASQEAILGILRDHGPLTDEQIALVYENRVKQGADVPRQSPSGLRTRRDELVKQGKVRDSEERGTTASGRRTIIWELVPMAIPRAPAPTGTFEVPTLFDTPDDSRFQIPASARGAYD